MRIFNRAHVLWFMFVCLATLAASLFYVSTFDPQQLSFGGRFAHLSGDTPGYVNVGGTPLGERSVHECELGVAVDAHGIGRISCYNVAFQSAGGVEYQEVQVTAPCSDCGKKLSSGRLGRCNVGCAPTFG